MRLPLLPLLTLCVLTACAPTTAPPSTTTPGAAPMTARTTIPCDVMDLDANVLYHADAGRTFEITRREGALVVVALEDNTFGTMRARCFGLD